MSVADCQFYEYLARLQKTDQHRLLGLPPHIENRVREKFRSEPLRGIVSRTGRRWRKLDGAKYSNRTVYEGIDVKTVRFGSLASELIDLISFTGGLHLTMHYAVPFFGQREPHTFPVW